MEKHAEIMYLHEQLNILKHVFTLRADYLCFETHHVYLQD